MPIDKELYCQYLICAQNRYSAVGLATLFADGPTHDAYTRWLNSVKLKPKIVWEYANSLVKKEAGYLIVDDTVLDKPYGHKIETTCFQYSGRHHDTINGIGVINLIWNGTGDTAKAEHIPTDFRVYDIIRDGKTKNDHVHNMLDCAKQRGFQNVTILADCSYSDLVSLKKIKSFGWSYVVGIKSNRQVCSSSEEQYQSVASLLKNIPEQQAVKCWLKDFGYIAVVKFRRTATANPDYLCSNNIHLSSTDIREANARRWKIEEFHRGEKQSVGLASCQFRNQRAQRNHILCATLAFLAIEKHRLEHGYSWYESKCRIIIDALRKYLREPFVPLPLNSLKPRHLAVDKV